MRELRGEVRQPFPQAEPAHQAEQNPEGKLALKEIKPLRDVGRVAQDAG